MGVGGVWTFMVVPIVAVWFDAYRRLLAVTGGYKLRLASFAPAEAGARAHLRGCAAPVGSQAYCSRLVYCVASLLGEFIGLLFQLQLFLCNVATNGSGRLPTARLARTANPGSGTPRLKPGPARTYAATPLRSDRKRTATGWFIALRVCWGSLLGGFQLQLHLCNVATNGSVRSPTARLARNANPGSGSLRLAWLFCYSSLSLLFSVPFGAFVFFRLWALRY